MAYTTRDVMRLFGVSRATVWRWTKKGWIVSDQDDGPYHPHTFNESEVDFAIGMPSETDGQARAYLATLHEPPDLEELL